MDFAQLSRYLPQVEATIARQYDRERRRRPPALRPYIADLAEFTLRGGKRFRALLVLAGFHLASGRRPDPVLPAAAAFEHFQTWMLVHDDLIDHSETRRGGPTLHRRLEAEFRARNGIGRPEEYGAGMSITLGDLAEPFTVDALLECEAPASRRLTAVAEYVRTTRDTAFGQALDIRNGTLAVEDVTEADVLAVHRFKTAVYTVAAPLRIGAILGGARPGLLDDLEAFGLDAGVAFQLRDDVLGTGFDAQLSGKSANDLAEGKRTLLVVRAWADADATGRAAIRSALGHPEATPVQLDAAREVLRATGSLAYSERKIAALTARAGRRVQRSRNLRPDGRRLLEEISDRLVRRAS